MRVDHNKIKLQNKYRNFTNPIHFSPVPECVVHQVLLSELGLCGEGEMVQGLVEPMGGVHPGGLSEPLHAGVESVGGHQGDQEGPRCYDWVQHGVTWQDLKT